MEYLLFVAGVVLGLLIMAVVYKFQTIAGILKIDHSDPEKDVYRLDIADLDKLDKKRRVALKIDHNADLSQK